MRNWADYAELLKPAEELLARTAFPASEAMKAQLWRQFAMNLSQGYFLLFQSTPDHPEFAPFENSVFLAQPNPDAVYYYAPVDGRGVYRVIGERGDAPVAGFALGNRIIGMDAAPGLQGGGLLGLAAADCRQPFPSPVSVRRPGQPGARGR